MMNVYVIWCIDGPTMVTLLQYDDTDEQHQAMQQWSEQDYINQAYDTEWPNEGGMTEDMTYELVGIFRADNLHWIV